MIQRVQQGLIAAVERKQFGIEQKRYFDRLLNLSETEHLLELGIKTSKVERFTFIQDFVQQLKESGIGVGDKIKINYSIGQQPIQEDVECTLQGFKFVIDNERLSGCRVFTLCTDPPLGNQHHINGIPIDTQMHRCSSLEQLTINKITNGVEVTGNFKKGGTEYYLKIEKVLRING